MITRFLFAFLIVSIAGAATKFVAPGGSGSGASWSSPASPSVINSSAPGDLIYLAGGAYGGGIPVQASGSAGSPITIRKATASDHGSDTGWTAAMDVQATFSSGWSITAHDVVVDGNNWKPPGLPTKFGIAIRHASGAKGIDAGGSSGNLTIRDVDVMGPGINASKAEADGIHFPSNTLISGCAAHDTDALLFAWKGNSGSTIEYCLLYNASSNIVYSGNPQDPHPDVIYSGGMFTNGTMRYCLVANVTSEGVFFDQELPGDNMVWYGNVMFQGDCQTGNTPIQLQNGAAFGKVFLYHNTFVDFNKSNNLGPGTSTANGGAVVNNLFINYLPNWDKGVNNNGFSSAGIGTSQIINAANPFVTSGTHRWVKGSGNPPATRVVTGAPTGYNPSGMESAFALADNSWAKGRGITVPAGRNVDMFGHSGNDLGAIQSGTSPAPTPSATPSPTASPSATPSPVPTASPSPGQPKFVAGDYVTPTAALNVRTGAAGPVIGQHLPGDIGQVVSGPENAPLNGTPVAWYVITWETAPNSGHSGDNDLIQTAGPSPTPEPSPSPTPVTYKSWTGKLNANQSDWIGKNPPYPDGE